MATDKAIDFTKTIPYHYDLGLGPVMFAEPARRMARHLAESRPVTLLETAAGTGLVTREVVNCLPDLKRYVATDLNPISLEIAKQKFDPAEGVAFQPADAMVLPFDDGAFDTVLCQFGMMLFPDKAKAYGEVRRVLQRGGRYVFSVWDSHGRNPFAAALTRTIGALFPNDVPRHFDTPYGYHSVDIIRGALQDHGFEQIRVAVHRPVSFIADPDAFARGFVRGTAFQDQIRERGGDLDAVAGEIANAFRRELGGTTALQYIFIDAVTA